MLQLSQESSIEVQPLELSFCLLHPDTKKRKKKKGGQGNKANLAATKSSKKNKVAKGIYFHCN